VPDEFTLVLPGAGGLRECRVVWRLGNELGAEFVDSFTAGFAQQASGRR